MDHFSQAQFAGFRLPRSHDYPTVGDWWKTPIDKRLEEFKKYRRGEHKCVGRVTYANRIVMPRKPLSGWGDYMLREGEFMGLRVVWCDEVPEDWLDGDSQPRIDHSGWFTDEYGDGDTIRGMVAKLPSGRGFLAGWGYGVGMIGELDAHVWDSARDAAVSADDMAQAAAEKEREYRAEEGEE